ncbi:acetyltransferase [Anaerovibrio sp.]|uniref:acetyltransferase n=1 Tax=Anaerovibrio sp. TaxID=1872532 RepID=UPI00388FBB71
MMMNDIVLVGFGGHAKSVADCIEREGKYHIVGYTDMREADSRYSYLGTDDELHTIFGGGVKNAAIGIGYMGKGAVRQHLYATLKQIGFYLPVITDPSAIVSNTAVVGEGTFIGKCAVINAEASIGKMAIINTKALIEHECVVDDFSHVAVGAVLCGQVKVGEGAFIGANSTVIQCRQIESNAIVPAGATIR